MKKLLYSILLVTCIILPVRVFAEGYISISPNSLTIEQGSTKKFTITAYNTIGDVTIKSNDNDIASISSSEWGTGMVDEKQTKTTSITITGKKVGNTTITILIDAATFDGDDLAGQTKKITVNVIPKSTPSQQPSKPTNNEQKNNLSKNNNIKILNVEGHDLIKEDNNNYTLTVLKDIANIKINATAEDQKAKVTGTGNHELKFGENNIQVTITSESGSKNIINIKVIRKEGYYLEDLNPILSDSNIQKVDIIIDSNSKITKEQLTKIKESKKIIRLNYYDETKKLIYSWILNGKEIKEVKEFTTAISFKTENQKEIYKLSNYADGLYIKFNHNGELPNGTKIKLFTKDKFENGSNINLYHFNNTNKSLDFIKKELKVKEGYIEFDIEHCSEYFITMSNIINIDNSKPKKTQINIFNIFEAIIIIILFIFILLKIKSNKMKLKTLESKINNNIELNDVVNNNNLNNNTSIFQDLNNENQEFFKSIDNENNNNFNYTTLNQEMNIDNINNNNQNKD